MNKWIFQYVFKNLQLIVIKLLLGTSVMIDNILKLVLAANIQCHLLIVCTEKKIKLLIHKVFKFIYSL